MGLLWTIIVGFVVGLIARAIMPGRQVMGFIMTTLLGIGGALLAGYAGQLLGLYKLGEPVGFVGAIVGAFILLFIYDQLRK
ncbi:MAG: GlsB/YeaQ/YmgE family stress response membrane protein [Burkholderiales bacterium]|nr:GlsB/YeaQ/YmgE family stress response membrane protein [Burkholderiales bacterium]